MVCNVCSVGAVWFPALRPRRRRGRGSPAVAALQHSLFVYISALVAAVQSLLVQPCVTAYSIMAGAVRQPIDIPSLERYIEQNVPALKTPLDVKQVSEAKTTVQYPC